MKYCPACAKLKATCALCEAGLEPVKGLNPALIFELATFLRVGSHECGARPGENVLSHAIRVVKESRSTLPALRLDLDDDLPPTMREPSQHPTVRP